MVNEKWIVTKLWRDSYFTPSNFDEAFEMYRCGLSTTLLASLLDGCGGEPVWCRDLPLTNSNTLFKHLKTFSHRVGGCTFLYITDPDNALSIIHWERVMDDDCSWGLLLEEFERNPAQEGGTSYLVCAFNNQKSVVVFEKDVEDFMITFYGTKGAKIQFLELLNTEEKSIF